MIGRDFILAGDATFTIETPDRGRRTYHVCKSKPNERFPNPAWFAELLTGPNNDDDYTYLGRLDTFTGQVVPTAKSRIDGEAFAFALLNRVLARVWGDDHEAFLRHGYKLHHEGRCGRCGRTLTVPASIESGIGPECSKRL